MPTDIKQDLLSLMWECGVRRLKERKEPFPFLDFPVLRADVIRWDDPIAPTMETQRIPARTLSREDIRICFVIFSGTLHYAVIRACRP